MKSFQFFSLLLIGFQLHDHCLQGHPVDKESHGGRNSPKYRRPPLKLQESKAINWHKIVPSNADFAFRFYKEIASNATTKNLLFSPLSISSAFALLSLGAKSETLNQIHKGLAFNLSKIKEQEIHRGFQELIHKLKHPNKAEVDMGNALFISENYKLEPTFLDDVRNFYESEGFSTNLGNSTQAEDQINGYVRSKTHGKITHLVENLSSNTLMVLVNYIFFKAFWKDPFYPDSIKEEDFFVDTNTTVKVKLMYERGYYNVLHDEDLSCWVVELPFKGDAVAWFILPDKGKLKHVEGALAKEAVSIWPTYFTKKIIRLSIPKFTISATCDMKYIFQRLGVTDVFSGNADLSGITSQHSLKVSKAIHRAVFDLNENYTVVEGAAGPPGPLIPYVSYGELSSPPPPPLPPPPTLPPPPPIIRFNKPFLLFIVEKKTNSILLMGKIVNPTEKLIFGEESKTSNYNLSG
ncbi:alpha-1-antitrypsin-like [Hemicordylus capensis]|uniref:alpha-1-antitrypsin-like n=1 Tax=Hemicordylus capensis TaxID=884348 RepID=UPI002302E9DD|nr:alpha-1-antitrypsin-like [Hemicordylus capensis]